MHAFIKWGPLCLFLAMAANAEGKGLEKAVKKAASGGKVNAPSPLVGKLSLGTSYGLVGIRKDGVDWRGGGMSDVTVGYRLGTKLGPFLADATFRYAPVAVAPQVEDGGKNFEYTGVVETYLFGVVGQMALDPSLAAVVSAEIGTAAVSLTDTIGVSGDSPPDSGGVQIHVGGGANWELLPSVTAGPRLNLGFGAFSVWQLSGNIVFAF